MVSSCDEQIKKLLWEFWFEALEAFTDMTKLVEAVGLVESAL